MRRRNSSSDPGAEALSLAAALLLLLAPLPGCGAPDTPLFDPDSAFVRLEEQVAIGPRHPGSAGHRLVQRYLVDRLRSYGANVSLQPFDAVTSGGDTLRLINIIANFNPDSQRRVMLGAHYDTRPVADRDPDPAARSTPIPGANDGASGVAVLLEIARLLGIRAPRIGVDIVLFDGEDSGDTEAIGDWCLGSAYFARNLKGYRPFAAIVIDMIGDRDLEIPMEGYSRAAAPRLLDELYDIAAELGYAQFLRGRGPTMVDDHLPLIQAGLSAVDLIDFDYPWWHTLEDTPDKCSPRSLEAVGRVLDAYIRRR